MKLGITGSRSISVFDFAPFFTLSDRDFAAFCRNRFGAECAVTAVLSGGARGIDTLAAECAARLGLQSVIFAPDRRRNPGRMIYRALHERNQRIVDNCDLLLAVWDGISTGTRDTCRRAEAAGRPVYLLTPHSRV